MSDSPVRYQIDPTPVGSGGFGKVRRGRDTVLDRDIAIKTLDPVVQAASETDRERFRLEARTLAQLTHPNIPAIYDVVLNESQFHIIFQYINGSNLREILADGPLAVDEARRWFGHIASALEHAHGRNRIHRDLKPENFIVTANRLHCYLADFGLALSPDEKRRLTKDGYVVGTPGYMSPEAEDGDTLDFSDDIYVLGICLYEALSGHRPAVADYRPLHVQNEAIPPALDSLIESCLAAKPRRLDSAKIFAQQLEHAFVVQRPLSILLSSGQLHEIIGVIRNLSADEFMDLPPGQRRLVVDKCLDLLAAKDGRLALARAEFFAVVTTIAVHVDPAQYREIVDGAIYVGFDYQKTASDWSGDRRVREAIKEAAIRTTSANHHELCEKLLFWLGRDDFEGRMGSWACHAIREIIDRLLANPHCSDENASRLSAKRREINLWQHKLESQED